MTLITSTDRLGSAGALDRAEDELLNLRRENRELREALQATRNYDHHRWNCRIGEARRCKECHDLKLKVVELRLDALDEMITLSPTDDPLEPIVVPPRAIPLIRRAPVDTLDV